jgi:hemerythrin
MLRDPLYIIWTDKSNSHLRENISALKAKSFLNKDPDAVINFLKNWWISHINVEDRKYERWISAQQNLPL